MQLRQIQRSILRDRRIDVRRSDLDGGERISTPPQGGELKIDEQPLEPEQLLGLLDRRAQSS